MKFALRASEMCLRHKKHASRVKFSLRESGRDFVSHSANSRIFHIFRKGNASPRSDFTLHSSFLSIVAESDVFRYNIFVDVKFH